MTGAGMNKRSRLQQRKGYDKIPLNLTIGDEEDNVIFLAWFKE